MHMHILAGNSERCFSNQQETVCIVKVQQQHGPMLIQTCIFFLGGESEHCLSNQQETACTSKVQHGQ